MLNELELKRLLDKHEVSPAGRTLIESIRHGNPSRNVEGRAGNVACRYPSKKMGCTIQAESHKNELAAIYIWEHDDQTYEYYDQPPQIKMSYLRADSGRRASHVTTPDFFVIQETFIGWVECKTEDTLIEKEKEQSPLFVRDESLTWQCPPGKEYAKTFGLGFQLRSSAQNPVVYVRNLGFLADYWSAAMPQGYEGKISLLRTRLASEKRMRLADLIEVEEFGGPDVLFYAVAKDQVYVDLHRELLSDPLGTNVYSSQEVATILNAPRASARSEFPIPPIKALRLAAGKTLTWSGSSFSVKSVGPDNVILQDTSGDLFTMKLDQVERYSRTGEIQGNEELVDTPCILSDRYRAASPDDLKEAARRLKILESMNTNDCIESSNKVSARTLRYWRQRKRQAAEQYADPVIGLVPRISARGNRLRKLAPRVIAPLAGQNPPPLAGSKSPTS